MPPLGVVDDAERTRSILASEVAVLTGVSRGTDSRRRAFEAQSRGERAAAGGGLRGRAASAGQGPRGGVSVPRGRLAVAGGDAGQELVALPGCLRAGWWFDRLGDDRAGCLVSARGRVVTRGVAVAECAGRAEVAGLGPGGEVDDGEAPDAGGTGCRGPGLAEQSRGLLRRDAGHPRGCAGVPVEAEDRPPRSRRAVQDRVRRPDAGLPVAALAGPGRSGAAHKAAGPGGVEGQRA